MNDKLPGCFIATSLGTTVALASPALARGGGGHGAGMGGGTHFGAMGGGARFAGGSFGYVAFSPRSSRFAFRDGFHHRFHRVTFFGVPYGYADYYGCWRQARTPYGLQRINACGDYAYGY